MASADQILEALRRHRAEFEAMGVRHMTLFGSQARGDSTPESDIDIGVAFDPAGQERGFAYFSKRGKVEDKLFEVLGTMVDISDEARMREPVQKSYAAEQISAF